MPGIFISYRRSDNPDATGRIYDRLVAEFGKARVFKDVDSIPLGQDFRGHLNDIVGNCAAVLAIIGPKWTDARSSAGTRRLEDPDDFVRIELEAALARDVPVVPVLVAHAPMPGTADLPASLASMAFRQSIEVRPDPDFHNDATRLVSALQRILDPNAPTAKPQANRRSNWISALAAAAAVAGIALAAFAWMYPRATLLPEIRTEIATPEMDRPQDIALSPDGRQIVFAAKDGDVTRLWLRRLDSEMAQSLPGTDRATDPFWSPDGRSVAFFTAEALKRFDLDGSLVRIIVARKFSGSAGGSWSEQGVILFATAAGGPIMRVPAAGGEGVPVTLPGAGTVLHVGPYFLAGGHRFLYTEVNPDGKQGAIYLGSMDGAPPVKLVSATNRGTWLPSGWLVWEQSGSLLAQRLDLDKASLTGDPVAISDRTESYAGRPASVANTGLIAIPRGGQRLMQLQWFDRSGVPAGAPAGAVLEPIFVPNTPRIARDGLRLAVGRLVQGNMDIWLLGAAHASRLTFEPSDDLFPVWSPDGSQIVFSSSQPGGVLDLEKMPSNGAGASEQLFASDQDKVATSWSADGYLMFSSADSTTAVDLWVLPMKGDRKPFVFLKTPFAELWGQFSPDGRWVAYQSDESGRNEIYLRPFVPPGVTGTSSAVAGVKLPVSTGGGVFPAWRPDGKELYFLDPSGAMMAVPMAITGATILPGAPVKLFQVRIPGGGVENRRGRQFDVAPDGRFLINTELDAGRPSSITLIQNWNPEAKRGP